MGLFGCDMRLTSVGFCDFVTVAELMRLDSEFVTLSCDGLRQSLGFDGEYDVRIEPTLDRGVWRSEALSRRGESTGEALRRELAKAL